MYVPDGYEGVTVNSAKSSIGWILEMKCSTRLSWNWP